MNELAQGLRLAERELGEASIEVGEGRIHEGDHVATRVNRGGHSPVHNRERWVVDAIDTEARTMTLRHFTESERAVALDADYLDRQAADAVGSVELGYAITKYGAQGMTVDRAFVVLGDGLSKEEAYTALTRAREATELYAVSREPVERAEIAPAKDERKLGADELGRQMERSEQHALAIDERLRGELERRSTETLASELHDLEAARDDPASRRAEAIRDARIDAERQFEAARAGLGTSAPSDRERVRLDAHAERVRELRRAERGIVASAPVPAEAGESAAAIERILAERRSTRVRASIEFEPAYVVNTIGARPDGLRDRLTWEHAVDEVERVRQRLGVHDRERPLGAEPKDAHARARWRSARREIEVVRARVAERAQERARGLSLGAEVGLER